LPRILRRQCLQQLDRARQVLLDRRAGRPVVEALDLVHRIHGGEYSVPIVTGEIATGGDRDAREIAAGEDRDANQR
jgi:hypothetical protein